MLQKISTYSKRGRPPKRSAEAQKLVQAFSTLTKAQIETLDTTTWSKKLPGNASTVWSIVCKKLKLKDNDKNKNWLAHIWQTNMWLVAEEVRKYVIK